MTGKKQGTVRALLVLGRVSNLPTVWTNCLAAWMLGGGEWAAALACLVAGASLMYAGGMYLNDACDVEFDRAHCPERPIPSGVVSERTVWLLGGGFLAAGAAVILVGTAAGWWWVAALAGAILIYDFVHKKWAGAVLLMGACRFLLYAVAATAALGLGERAVAWVKVASPLLGKLGVEWSVEGELAYLAGAGMFFYIVGITLAARGESTGGKVGALPVILLLAPLWVWFLMIGDVATLAGEDPASVVFPCLFGLWMARCGWLLRAGKEGRVGKYVASLLAGIVLADALFLSVVDGTAPWICVAFLPVNRLLQRFVPAT